MRVSYEGREDLPCAIETHSSMLSTIYDHLCNCYTITMKQSLIASCPIAGIAKPKVVCGHLTSQPWYTTLGQGSRPTNLTKHAKVDHVFVSTELRHRGQLVSCKAESSGKRSSVKHKDQRTPKQRRIGQYTIDKSISSLHSLGF